MKGILQVGLPDEWAHNRKLDSRIEELDPTAFDLYVRYRRQIYVVHVDEARWRVMLLERIYSEVEKE